MDKISSQNQRENRLESLRRFLDWPTVPISIAAVIGSSIDLLAPAVALWLFRIPREQISQSVDHFAALFVGMANPFNRNLDRCAIVLANGLAFGNLVLIVVSPLAQIAMFTTPNLLELAVNEGKTSLWWGAVVACLNLTRVWIERPKHPTEALRTICHILCHPGTPPNLTPPAASWLQ